jgi:hypothetical protein
VGDARRVGHDQSAADGVVECAAQDHVDLDDCLRVEASVAVCTAVVGEIGVEAFEVIGPEAAEREPPDCGRDVEVDVAPVRVVSACPQSELLGRQPTLGEVHGNGERRSLEPVVVASSSELGGEPLRVPAVGAGGMPSPSFATGDRVGAS